MLVLAELCKKHVQYCNDVDLSGHGPLGRAVRTKVDDARFVLARSTTPWENTRTVNGCHSIEIVDEYARETPTQLTPN